MSDSPVFSDGELLEAFSDYSDLASLNSVDTAASGMAEEPPVDDGFCTFQVGNFLYRISSDFFNESSGVNYKIHQAQALGGGTSDRRPIVISGITSHEMDCLLDAAESRDSRIPFRRFDMEVLRTALKSAIKFRMVNLISHVINLFEAMDPPLQLVQKLRLADEFGIKAWLQSAYLTLCQRGPRPSGEEGLQLGVLRCLAIWRLRDEGCRNLKLIEEDQVLRTSDIVTPTNLSGSLSFATAVSPIDEVVKHPIYYLHSVILQIKGKAYRVPRYIFAEERPSAERLKDASEKMSAVQLARLLDCISTSDATIFTQLEPALEAATILRLRTIRSHLIQQIEGLDPSPSPTELISLADRCAVQHWLKPQYTILCRREDRLTSEEAKVLGMERAMAISNIKAKRLRQMIQIGTLGSHSNYRGSASDFFRQKIDNADASGNVTRQLVDEEPSLSRLL